jgi:hypothetical protein
VAERGHLDLVDAWLRAFQVEATPHDPAPTGSPCERAVAGGRAHLWVDADRLLHRRAPCGWACSGRWSSALRFLWTWQRWTNAKSPNYTLDDADKAKVQLERLARSLDEQHPSAAASLREGLDETLTVLPLGLGAAQIARDYDRSRAPSRRCSACRDE